MKADTAGNRQLTLRWIDILQPAMRSVVASDLKDGEIAFFDNDDRQPPTFCLIQGVSISLATIGSSNVGS
jgi:hypothetical protein